MRVVAKALDHRADRGVLRADAVGGRGQGRRKIGDQVFGQAVQQGVPSEMVGAFARAKGDGAKELFPRANGVGMSVRQSVECEAIGLAVFGKGVGRGAPERAGKLVWRDQQGEPATRVRSAKWAQISPSMPPCIRPWILRLTSD